MNAIPSLLPIFVKHFHAGKEAPKESIHKEAIAELNARIERLRRASRGHVDEAAWHRKELDQAIERLAECESLIEELEIAVSVLEKSK